VVIKDERIPPAEGLANTVVVKNPNISDMIWNLSGDLTIREMIFLKKITKNS
jgi:hypothetical protein